MSTIDKPERVTQSRVIDLFAMSWAIAISTTGQTVTATATSRKGC